MDSAAHVAVITRHVNWGVACFNAPTAGIKPNLGYRHEVKVLRGKGKSASTELLPRVHRVSSLLKRWLLGTHQSAVSAEHLDSYLDEFTFRFNRRTSKSRGKLFYRLIQQAVQDDPVTYRDIVGSVHDV